VSLLPPPPPPPPPPPVKVKDSTVFRRFPHFKPGFVIGYSKYLYILQYIYVINISILKLSTAQKQ
jgi:hypothetical protein